MLDRAAEVLGGDRALAVVVDDEVGDTLTELWGEAKPATWNRNRAAVGSWLTWCATKKNRATVRSGASEHACGRATGAGRSVSRDGYLLHYSFSAD